MTAHLFFCDHFHIPGCHFDTLPRLGNGLMQRPLAGCEFMQDGDEEPLAIARRQAAGGGRELQFDVQLGEWF